MISIEKSYKNVLGKNYLIEINIMKLIKQLSNKH